jgi:hypothetical protein
VTGIASLIAIVVFFEAAVPVPPAPEPLLVVLKAGLTEEEIESAWDLFRVPPTETPEGYNPEGIAGVGAFDGEHGEGFLVNFHAGTPEASRAQFVARVLRSPLVDRIENAGSEQYNNPLDPH